MYMFCYKKNVTSKLCCVALLNFWLCIIKSWGPRWDTNRFTKALCMCMRTYKSVWVCILLPLLLIKLGNLTRITNLIWHKKINNHINISNDNIFIEYQWTFHSSYTYSILFNGITIHIWISLNYLNLFVKFEEAFSFMTFFVIEYLLSLPLDVTRKLFLSIIDNLFYY